MLSERETNGCGGDLVQVPEPQAAWAGVPPSRVRGAPTRWRRDTRPSDGASPARGLALQLLAVAPSAEETRATMVRPYHALLFDRDHEGLETLGNAASVVTALPCLHPPPTPPARSKKCQREDWDRHKLFCKRTYEEVCKAKEMYEQSLMSPRYTPRLRLAGKRKLFWLI